MTAQTRIAKTLRNAPAAGLMRFRAAATAAPLVERGGGKFGGGLIRRVSLITRGEALGHGVWIDFEFVSQVQQALAAAGAAGIKSRFTHPDMSADGLAKYLGRAVAAGGDAAGQAFGDLHLAKSAARSPDGDLSGYVLDRTAEDPASFGASIVFYRDEAAEVQFLLEHGATIDGDWIDTSGFRSPDDANEQNLPHVRLATLEAADLVDEPAANPAGMFGGGSGGRGIVADFATLADYALGLSTTPPASVALDVNPDRLRNFVGRYFSNRGLSLSKGGSPVSVKLDDAPAPVPAPADENLPPVDPAIPATAATTDDDEGILIGDADPDADTEVDPATPPATPPAPPAANAELSRYMAAFGDGPGARLFLDGISFEAAMQKQLAAQVKEIETLKRQLALKEKEAATPLKASAGNTGTRVADHVRPRD